MSENRNMLKELQEMGWTANDIHNLLKEIEEELGLTVQGANKTLSVDEDAVLNHKVTKIMNELGVPFNIKGAKYIRESIIYMVKNEFDMQYTKVLYPHVAKKFDTTTSRVERAIRHAIERAFDRGNDEMLELFGYTVSPCKGRPTNSEFLSLVADRIKQGLI